MSKLPAILRPEHLHPDSKYAVLIYLQSPHLQGRGKLNQPNDPKKNLESISMNQMVADVSPETFSAISAGLCFTDRSSTGMEGDGWGTGD
jgi:hypothetical protein